MVERALVSKRRHSVTGPREDEKVTSRIRGDAGHFTQVRIRGQREKVCVRVVRDCGHRLCGQRSGRGKTNRQNKDATPKRPMVAKAALIDIHVSLLA